MVLRLHQANPRPYAQLLAQSLFDVVLKALQLAHRVGQERGVHLYLYLYLVQRPFRYRTTW